MPEPREPRLHPVAIAELRPTQITVGMREVQAKRQAWRARSGDKGSEFLGRHAIPVIIGPNEHAYVIDHHHLARALLEEGQPQVLTTVVADLRKLERDSFWFVLDNRGWLHPFDADGRRRPYSDVPKSIGALVDDPYRSLAGELRLQGGYAKDTTPFAEFLWADFLRSRIRRGVIEAHFEGALAEAARLAKLGDADYLPGWCGPVAR